MAPQDMAFGLRRMYQAHRELAERGSKQVAVFRSMADAPRWLAGPTS
jgi:hypothetical protein